MLIDFQSKFNNFNDVLFSDQVSGCDFEFSSVLRRWWWVGGRDGIRMEKTWRGSGPFNKSPFIELLQLLQIYIIVVVCFHLFWHSEVLNWISYKLLTNFELAPISISFAPLFQFYYLPSLIFCWQKTLCYVLKRVFLLFVFLTRLDTVVRLNFVMTCFLFI